MSGLKMLRKDYEVSKMAENDLERNIANANSRLVHAP